MNDQPHNKTFLAQFHTSPEVGVYLIMEHLHGELRGHYGAISPSEAMIKMKQLEVVRTLWFKLSQSSRDSATAFMKRAPNAPAQ